MPQTQFKNLFLLMVLCQGEPLQKEMERDIKSNMYGMKRRDCDMIIKTT